MNISAKEKANKRLDFILKSNKPNEIDSTKKARWDFNKEYSLNFHDKSISELDIILNTEIFQGIQENDIIELVFPKTISNTELSLFFRVLKDNFDVSKTKSNISIITCYNELIREQKINKSSVFVRLVNNSSKYFIDKITIILKNHFLLRKDLFDIMQNMLNEPVFIHKDVKINKLNGDDVVFGKVKQLTKNSKNVISGIIHSSTQFVFKSVSGTLYFLVEISKETYDFSFFENNTKFETIIKYFKSTFCALKEKGSVHEINIIFFTRIFFSKEIYNNLIKKFDKIPSFISYSSCGEFFFDLYTNVLTINNISNVNPNKIECDIINKLHKAFLHFAVGFKCRNLNTYIKNIYSEYEIIFSKCKKEVISTNPPTFPYSTIFENIDNFRIMKSNYSNFFECINVVLKDIRFEKINLNRVGSLITVVSSGEYFPYYNKDLSKFTKYNLYEIGIPLFYIIFSAKKPIYHKRKFSKKHNSIAEEYQRNIHHDFTSSKSNYYDNLHRREIRDIYIYEPDQDDHHETHWIKILYINFPFSVENYSTDAFKIFNRKNFFKDYVDFENEIFNVKKIQDLQQLRKRKKSFSSPKINLNIKVVTEKFSEDFTLSVAESSNSITTFKEHSIDNYVEKISMIKKETKAEEESIIVLEESMIKNNQQNMLQSRRNSVGEYTIDEIKDKLCNYSRKTVDKEKESKFIELVNEYDNEIFNYKKIMPTNNSQMNLKINEDDCINQRVNKILKKDISLSTINRNVLNDLDTNERDEFEIFIETITEIPLLTIFSNFTAPKFVIKNYQMVLKEKSSFLHEIIFARLNKNFQIVKKFTHNEENHKYIDYNKCKKLLI